MLKYSMLVLWFMLVGALVVQLSVKHAPLPGPEQSPTTTIVGQLHTTHVLAPQCPCSLRLAQHLQQRHPGAHESILIAGDDPLIADQLKMAGWEVINDVQQAEQVGIHGAPWLLIQDDAGRRHYSGGHGPAEHISGTVTYQEQVIRNNLHQGVQTVPYPSYGCATSTALKSERKFMGMEL